MAKISSIQIKDYSSGTQYPTLDAYLSGVNYYPQSFGTNRNITVSLSNVVAISSTLISGNVAIGASSTTNNGGVCVAQNTVSTITGQTTTFTDALGSIVNLCEIRDSSTNDPVLDSSTGKQIYGLLQVKSGVADGTAIGGSGSENIMISFVILDNSDAFSLVTVSGTFEFTYNRRYSKRFIPDKTLIGTASQSDFIQPYTPVITKLTITTAFIANEVITISTGSGATAGVATVSGTVVTLPASATLFNTTSTIQIFRNGVRQEKGTGLEVVWDSTGSFHFTEAISIGEEIEIQV